jgi:hypothetical protein
VFSKFREIAKVTKQQGQFGNFENTSEISPFQNEQRTGTEFKTLIQLKYLEN